MTKEEAILAGAVISIWHRNGQYHCQVGIPGRFEARARGSGDDVESAMGAALEAVGAKLENLAARRAAKAEKDGGRYEAANLKAAERARKKHK